MNERVFGVSGKTIETSLKTNFTALLLILILASLLLLALLPPVTPEAVAHPSSDEGTHVLITEIYPNTATRNEPDEYVAITNPCARSVNIEGWSITDNEGTIIFPPFDVVPDQTVYVTRNASAFVVAQRSAVTREAIVPDFEYGSDSDPKVSQMQTVGRAFVLRNTGDEVILQDENGREVDVVLYGDSSYEGEGWRDEPLGKPREGTILIRKGVRDTNQCDDWLVLPFGASYHAPDKFSCSGSGSATAFVSPDCSFRVLQGELNTATSSLYINLYQFDNPYLMDLLVDALDRGVDVQLLLEGTPVGGITGEELYIAETIAKSGGEVRFADDPFINHAKYAIIDNETAVVMTENWKTTGVPTNNSFGNRGWGIVLRNEEVADYFTEVFLEDFYRAKEFAPGLEKTNSITRAIPQGSYAPAFEPRTVTGNFTVIPVLAPDTALSNETILGAIQSAQESIFVQQFSAGRFWSVAPNTFIAALIAAARRGCEVKVLLDSRDYNVDAWNDNDEAVAWLEQVAREENLNLEAKLADLDGLGLAKVHTKGLIMDGKKVIITSLNWNANSGHNREAGVIVENEEIASFFEDVFFHDWNVSVNGAPEGIATGKAAERGGRTPLKLKVVGVAVTLILSFVIFRIVKWYKRL